MNTAELTDENEKYGQLYSRLLGALHNAALNEIQLAAYLHDTKVMKKDIALLQKLEATTTVVLPECMGRLIGELELHNSFLSLGRYIRSFADAEFVIEKLEGLIISRLEKNKIVAPYPIIESIVGCCTELENSKSML